MAPRTPDDDEGPSYPGGTDAAGPDDADLWFLPPPIEEDDQIRPPAQDRALITDWTGAEAAHAARLARVAGRLGALDERLRRGPEGWRHRLAVIEASELGWHLGERIGPDRLALWLALRLAGVQEDAGALARVGWAVRRLTGGPGPEPGRAQGLAGFLDRRDPETATPEADRLSDRVETWSAVMVQGRDLHPISRACMGFHLWNLAGLSQQGDRLEAAVTAARIAATDCGGAIFAPLALGGGLGASGALRSGGPPGQRLGRWLDAMDRACLAAMRHLDDIEAWAARAATTSAPLSGRTPPALLSVLTEWPFVSAPMAERLTGASRAAVQRNLDWMERHGLIREVTGQGRFRMWRAAT